MLKRLIEVALPLKEVSEQSAREKSIRHGHISTLHIWWARRPLAACRAVVFASLIPDPDDPDCPEHFRQLVRTELADSQFKPKDSNGSTIEDTPRNRCLEFIKHLVRWENSNEPHYIEPARKLIKEAHKILHPDSDSDVPKVLDPFAGGGAIPLEALRLGCEAHAIDINPVAHLIELCTLVYPQKFGKPLPKDKPVPDYIRRLIAHNRAKGKDKSHATLFEKSSGPGKGGTDSNNLIPDVEVSEAEYRKNTLAADVKYWGYWVLANARKELEQFYPPDEDGSVPVAYLWARTVTCSNPACRATIPLVRQLWLCKKKNRKVAMRLVKNGKAKTCKFVVTENKEINFDPDHGTMQRGQASCPFCNSIVTSKYLQGEGHSGRMEQQLMTVVVSRLGLQGKYYREPQSNDFQVYESAGSELSNLLRDEGDELIPSEPLIAWSGVFNAPLFGMKKWGDLFNFRQKITLAHFSLLINESIRLIRIEHDNDYAVAVSTHLAMVFDWFSEKSTTLTRWHTSGEKISGTYGRQALPMVWDYAETVPITTKGAGFLAGLEWSLRVIASISEVVSFGNPLRGSADRLPFLDGKVNAIITDPPYYDAVPYSDLSDFFYVWQKRNLRTTYDELFKTPLTPKSEEIISHLGKNYPGRQKTANDYEDGMAQAFVEMNRTLDGNGIGAVMFAHKTTSAWETIIGGLIRSGLLVTSSWPFHTEMASRLRGHGSAALASSVTIICRKRSLDAVEGLWDDVRSELNETATERLDFFWNQGIRGADFFISAIGPTLSVFGKYGKVVRLSGETVTVKQFLEEVRSVVTEYALNKIIKQSGRGQIDPETRFYVVWKWSYSDTKVPADEAFTMAKALGLDTEMMWDRTGTLEKSGQNVQAMPITKRMSIGNLGEPEADSSPGSMIDVLHRMCGYRDKGDTTALTEFLARSGYGRNETLWLVAQAISEILPDGNKEKQLLQGLLNQREGIMEAARDAKLF
jgi:adenine-specific DNA methylase